MRYQEYKASSIQNNSFPFKIIPQLRSPLPHTKQGCTKRPLQVFP